VTEIPNDDAVLEWFFGCVQLWSDTLGTALDLTDFIISTADGDRYVHLEPLRQYVQKWWDAADSLGDNWSLILGGLRAYVENSQYLHHGDISHEYRLFLQTVEEFITVSEVLLSWNIEHRWNLKLHLDTQIR
jgi:hypothetical protein